MTQNLNDLKLGYLAIQAEYINLAELKWCLQVQAESQPQRRRNPAERTERTRGSIVMAGVGREARERMQEESEPRAITLLRSLEEVML